MSTVFIHPTSVVDPGATIGPGTKIWHFCHVMTGARIGNACILGQNVFIASGVVIGDRVKVQNNVSVYAGVTVEDEVFLGPSMVFTNVTTPRSAIDRKDEFQPTLVKKGATIGANATILCGLTLGEHCFVGAGAVVTRDIPAYALVYGNPARQAGWVCQCGVNLNFSVGDNLRHACCDNCGKRYTQTGDQITLDTV
jgi:UDP-2-acetamido-3-amino-2,3-dideoxy-glucuronate N-acetyltransferase